MPRRPILLVGFVILGVFYGCREEERPISATDADLTATPPHLYDRVAVLSIGISNFQNQTLNLHTPADTATRLASLLEKQYGYTVAPPLINEQATKIAIEQSIREYQDTLSANDALILFISTHGVSVPSADSMLQGFLVPFDADVDLQNTTNFAQWERQAIGMRWLGDQVKRMKARHVLVIVEACCSGYMGLMGDTPFMLRSHELLAKKESRAALTAGTAVQLVKEGVFGSALIDALSRQSRAMTSRELHLLLRDRVMSQAGGEMTPQFRELLADAGEFVFVPLQTHKDHLLSEIQASNQKVLKYMGSEVTLSAFHETYGAIGYRFSSDPVGKERIWQAKLDQFRSHAAAGNPIAMAALFCCYSKGLGTQSDERTALSWAQETFDSGHAIGRFVLAECFSKGIGVSRNQLAAERLMREGAEMGFLASRVWLLNLQLNPQQLASTTQPSSHAIDDYIACLEALMGESSDWARVELANSYAGTWGGTDRKSLHKAAALLMPAANRGYPRAQAVLAEVYANALWDESFSLSVDDAAEAIRWLTAAANNGDADAQFLLASHHLQEDFYQGWSGMDVPKSYSDARKWAELGARQNHTQSQMLLAHINEYGYGQDIDLTEALKLVEAAAEKGYAAAYVKQGWWCLIGTVYPRNDERAVHLFQRAASQNNVGGYFGLGYCYDNLRGIPTGPDYLWAPDPRPHLNSKGREWYFKHHAVHYYLKAADLGSAEALKKLEYLWTWRSMYEDSLRRQYPESAQRFKTLMLNRR